MFLCIFDFRSTGIEIPLTPRCNDLHIWSKCLDGKFKANLIVALARRTVSNGIRTFFFCNFNELFCNDRTGKTRAKKIFILINGAGL